MKTAATEKPQKEAAPLDIQKMLEKFDWEAHWTRVLEKVSRDADAFEVARAASRAQAARKVFV